MSIDHVDIRVADLERSAAFYSAALAALGWRAKDADNDPTGQRTVDFDGGSGTEFAIHEPSDEPGQDTVTTGAHIAFAAESRAVVDRFHAAATRAGGIDIGAPGPRPQYGGDYYGAFVLDPDGNNIEAVCSSP